MTKVLRQVSGQVSEIDLMSGAVAQLVEKSIAVSTTTTSAVFADLLSQAITIADNNLFIQFSCCFDITNSADSGLFKMLIDGATVCKATVTDLGATGHGLPLTMQFKTAAPLAAGAHTVKIQWANATGLSTLTVDPVGLSEYASVAIWEVT